MSSENTIPTTSPRDLEPFSVNGRYQVWIVEQNREGWYNIKSFPFGSSLEYSDGPASHLISSGDDGSNAFQWKFLQDTATGTLRCVPRLHTNLALQEANAALSLVSYTGASAQRYQIFGQTIWSHN
jgi:hypothetical protein